MHRRGHPERIRAALHEVLRKVGTGRRGVPAEVVRAWMGAVGPTVARVTRPERLERGVLTVLAKNSVWVSELLMLQDRLLAVLRDSLHEPLVTALRFRVGRVSGPTPVLRAPPPPPARPPRALSPALDRRLECVRDDDLRAAIRRALSRCG